MTRTVWAFAELEELNGEMGFVAVADDLAECLLKAGQVQDPYLTELLKLIGTDPARRSGRYATRQIKAGEPDETNPETKPAPGPDPKPDDATASATKPQQTPKPAPQPEQMPKPAPPKPDPQPAPTPAARRGRPPTKAK
jgi:outer membrane biosynthesis protein TonB